MACLFASLCGCSNLPDQGFHFHFLCQRGNGTHLAGLRCSLEQCVQTPLCNQAPSSPGQGSLVSNHRRLSVPAELTLTGVASSCPCPAVQRLCSLWRQKPTSSVSAKWRLCFGALRMRLAQGERRSSDRPGTLSQAGESAHWWLQGARWSIQRVWKAVAWRLCLCLPEGLVARRRCHWPSASAAPS